MDARRDVVVIAPHEIGISPVRSIVDKSVFGRVVDDVEQSAVRIVKVDFGVEVSDLELQNTSGELLIELAENDVLSFLGFHGLCEHQGRLVNAGNIDEEEVPCSGFVGLLDQIEVFVQERICESSTVTRLVPAVADIVDTDEETKDGV